jgi:hypothetical protein
VRGVGRHCGRHRNLCEEPPIGPAKSQRTIGFAIDLKPLFVDRSVVLATEQGEVRERGRAPVRPVTDVVALAETHAAPREAAAAVAMLERPA